MSTPQPLDATSQDALLALKLTPPPVRTTLVIRSRLVEALNVGIQYALTLISAPAGGGKSTLLSTWVEHLVKKGVFVAWVSLDKEDNDPSQFWKALISALKNEFPSIGLEALATLRSSKSHVAKSLLAFIIHELTSISKPLVIVLDDYHIIEQAAIHEAFAFFLEHLPPHIHMVIATRTSVSLPLTLLRVQGRVFEIHANDMRFTTEETEAFLQQVMALRVSKKVVDILVERTEGWVAGLQLAALALQSQQNQEQFITRFSGSHTYIADYLAEEILQRQTEDIQHFLSISALLDRFNGSLCDAVLQREGSQLLLRNLERMNLFLIPLDEQREWYRFHHLFAEFLRNWSEQQSDTQRAVFHLRAAHWLEQHGYIEDAFHHFLAAKDIEQAVHLVEQQCEPLLRQGNIIALLRLIEALPDELIKSNPYLALNHAALLCSTDSLEQAERRIRDVEQALGQEVFYSLAHVPLPELHDEQQARFLRAGLTVLQVSLASFRGDIAQTIELSQQVDIHFINSNAFLQSTLQACLGAAYTLNGQFQEASRAFLEAEATGKVANHIHVVLASAGSRAYILMEQGHLHQAAQQYQQMQLYAIDESGVHYPVASLAYLGIGELYYTWNKLDKAEQSLQDGMKLAQQWGHLTSVARGMFYLALTRYAQGNADDAFALLKEVERQALLTHVSHIITQVGATRAHLWLMQGKLPEALHWAQGCGLSEHDTMHYLDEFSYLTLAKIFLTADKLHQATSLLHQLLIHAKQEDRMRSVVDILILQALVAQKEGHTKQAQSILSRALELAEPESIIRPFVDQEDSICQLLVAMLHIYHHSVSPGSTTLTYLDTLLFALNQASATQLSEQPRFISDADRTNNFLSRREQEILHLLASGLSNQQIADKLVVTTGTVKWYLKHIYRKFDAHSRTQVIMQAKARQLL